MMKKMISWMGVMGALVSSAYAASATVWSAEDGNGTVPPVGAWYKYPTKTTNGATATFVTDSIHGYKTLKASVSATNESSAAGMGFAWAKNEGEISLAAYKGVCLTYSATSQFRLEFKQSTISDYDYYGVVLNKSTAQKSVFIDFADLTQEGWGDAADFDLTAQQALQFAYKQSLAAETGNSTTNTIAISAVSLGNSCGGHAPELIATETEKDLNEGDTLKLDLSKVFADEDEDIVSYSVSIVSEKAGAVKLADSLYAKTGSVKLVTGANPSGSATVTVIAVDATKKSAGYVLTVTPVDRENAPVAVNDSYTTKEEIKLVKSTLSTGVMLNDYDPDDDDFVPVLVSTTSHGVLEFNEKTGGFTYVPDKDFFGADTFTYQLVETKETDPLTSDVGVAVINVTNVNDPLTVVIGDSTMTLGEDTYKLGDPVDEGLDAAGHRDVHGAAVAVGGDAAEAVPHLDEIGLDAVSVHHVAQVAGIIRRAVVAQLVQGGVDLKAAAHEAGGGAAGEIVLLDQQGLQADKLTLQRRGHAGVAGADHDDIVFGHMCIPPFSLLPVLNRQSGFSGPCHSERSEESHGNGSDEILRRFRSSG